ncbi:response regulator [Consotaella aegiceratis]|uniref:response regulator n=1 Tax=Consotaella aegiceratis TaxID=3097961 RepID=UPI002F3F7AFF
MATETVAPQERLLSADRVLLLVEDNPADADVIRDLLEATPDGDSFQVLNVTRLDEAKKLLVERSIDVVLLDLRLPDAAGTEGVAALLEISKDLPIIVLTGMDDETLALKCIDAGAQDYLSKDEIASSNLRRSIGYAMARLREAQIRELQSMLAGYRTLSSSGVKTGVTASIAGVGALKERREEDYAKLLDAYSDLFARYIDQLAYRQQRPTRLMDEIATILGDLQAGPRDLLDLHVAALEELIHGVSVERARSFVIEGRLLALEMMGLLVDFYRTGRRRFFSGSAT